MTKNNRPITPPPELVEQWTVQGVNREAGTSFMTWFATQAAQWGSDQELEACEKWIAYHPPVPDDLRAARRPKPPSLKEQALTLLDKAEDPSWDINDFSIVRKALEQLND